MSGSTVGVESIAGSRKSTDPLFLRLTVCFGEVG